MDLLFYIVLSAALVAGIITQLKWALEDLALPQHPDQHRSERPVLLVVGEPPPVREAVLPSGRPEERRGRRVTLWTTSPRTCSTNFSRR